MHRNICAGTDASPCPASNAVCLSPDLEANRLHRRILSSPVLCFGTPRHTLALCIGKVLHRVGIFILPTPNHVSIDSTPMGVIGSVVAVLQVVLLYPAIQPYDTSSVGLQVWLATGGNPTANCVCLFIRSFLWRVTMKVLRAIWLYYKLPYESYIKARYRQTDKGQAERDRVYWKDRTEWTRRQGKYARTWR